MKKGMINLAALSDYIERVVAWVQDIQTTLRSAVPDSYPPFERQDGGLYYYEDYRAYGYVEGFGPVYGISRRWLRDHDLWDTFHASRGAKLDQYTAARFLTAPRIDYAGSGEFFDRFGSHGDFRFAGKKYPRGLWKAGTYDREIIEVALAALNERLEAVIGKLDRFILNEYVDFHYLFLDEILVNKEWTWISDDPPGHEATTLEDQPGELSDLDPQETIELRFPLTHGSGGPRYWDAAVAEVEAERAGAFAVIDELQTVVIDEVTYNLRDALRRSVHLWRRGKQYSFRGP